MPIRGAQCVPSRISQEPFCAGASGVREVSWGSGVETVALLMGSVTRGGIGIGAAAVDRKAGSPQ